jgi:membrane-bound lytic murein transglycosylase B
MSDDAIDVLESVADFLCSHDREGTAVLVRAVGKEYARKAGEIKRLRAELLKRDEAADAAERRE